MEGKYGYCWVAYTLIASVSAARLVYLAFWCPLDLAPDEAYYWDWSRQLDWSYHSKGPLVAWLIRASCACLGETAFAVRVPAVACGALLLLGLFRLTREIYRDDRLALAVLGLALTMPVVAAGASLMTIDAPFTCAWMWALVFAWRAVDEGRTWAWIATGLCILLGLLAKATMVLWVPSFLLFLFTTPTMRSHCGRIGPWLALGIGMLGGVPLLWWNAVNGWVTLRHTQSHAGFEDHPGFHGLGPVRFFGAQAALLLGFWFATWVWALWRHRPTQEARPHLRFLWWMSAPTVAFFALFSFKNGGGEPNWPIVAYQSGMVLAAGTIWDALSGPRAIGRLVQIGTLCTAFVGLLATFLLHQPLTLQPALMQIAGPATPERPMPMRRVDPTVRLRGWRYLAEEVDRVRAELRSRGIEPILAAERWTQAGELAFYCEGQPTTYCFGIVLGDRDSQYDLWRPNPLADAERFKGQTFVVVGLEMDRLRDRFDSYAEVRPVLYCENGHRIAEWTITIAHGYRGP